MDRHMMYAGVSVVLAGLLGFSWRAGAGLWAPTNPRRPNATLPWSI